MNDELRTKVVINPNDRMDPGFLILVEVPDEAAEKPGQVFPLKQYSTVGRLKTNGVVLSHSSVSREHCGFELRHDGYYVVDEGSANGTIVGGKRVRDGQLQRHESMQIGGYRLLFWQGNLDDATLAGELANRGVSIIRP